MSPRSRPLPLQVLHRRASLPAPVSAGVARSALVALVLLGLVASCGDEDNGSGGSGPLPVRPELVEPSSGATLSTDFPIFTVRNAQGFDSGEANYTFRVTVASTDRDVAMLTVPAGRGTTSMQFPGPLLRGATLAWSVTARDTSGAETVSGIETFRLPPVECASTSDPYAKTVEGFWVPAVCLAQNIYNDPEEVLGPPDARAGDDIFFGFVSLGNGGWVDVDMEACAFDGAGGDIRVFQSVGSEPVTLLASSSPEGPWVLVEYRKVCNTRNPGTFSRRCDFDLAEAGLEEARYVRVQDGELFPCPGDTTSEGADIDAVQLLNLKP